MKELLFKVYLIVGASGFLGSYLIRRILENTDEKIVAASRKTQVLAGIERVTPLECDVRTANGVKSLCAAAGGAKVIWLAACHDIDFVEKNPDIAAETNLAPLKLFFESCKSFGSFFFSSSDVVYGEGAAGQLFCETDEYRPLSEYARQKIRAEELVLKNGGNVLRLPYMFGSGTAAGKEHFYDKLRHNLLEGKPVTMFTDSVRSTLSYAAAAALIVRLTQEKSVIPHVLNIACDEATSKHLLGLRFAQLLGADEELVLPVKSADITDFSHIRAFWGAMDNSLLKETLNIAEIPFSF